MNENNETMEIMDADIDAEWDDAEGTPEAPVTPEPAPKEETPAEPEKAPESAPEEPAKAEAPELFTLKRMGETRQVGRDDLIAMAQKGWDYDAVKQERDQLRQYRQDADPALELVKTAAAESGMDVAGYINWCRQQSFMRHGMNEQDAKNKVAMENERAELDRRQAAITAQEQAQTSAQAQAAQRQERIRADIASFNRAYPNVDPKSISKEVWDAVQQGESLTNAYTMSENKRLQAELNAKQQELDAERQNKANQAKTPGSLGGNVAAELDEIDRLWGEDD